MVFQRIMLAGLFFLLASFVATNSIAADVKIGIMNVQKIIVECDAGKEAKGRFDQKMKELQATFKAEEEALKALQTDIKKKSSVWSEEKKSEKVREFQRKGRDLQAKTEDARLEMKALQDKELEPILKALEKIVDQYGKDKKYSAILDSKNGVIYFDKSVDISEAIVKKLNGALAK